MRVCELMYILSWLRPDVQILLYNAGDDSFQPIEGISFFDKSHSNQEMFKDVPDGCPYIH